MKEVNEKALMWSGMYQEAMQIVTDKDREIKLLKKLLVQVMLTLEEDTVPSPYVKGARNRMIKTIEAINLAL